MKRVKNTNKVLCRDCGKIHPNPPGDITSYTCSTCVMKSLVGGYVIIPPTKKVTEVVKTKKVKVVKEKKVRGRPGWPQGWHRKIYFEGPDGKIYSRGKVTKNGDKIKKEYEKAQKAKTTSKTGFAQGWHRKKCFIAPDGTVYHRGKVADDPVKIKKLYGDT